MSDNETDSRPSFYGGPRDGEPTPPARRDRTFVLLPHGCENGFYVLHDNDRYEWREVARFDPLA